MRFQTKEALRQKANHPGEDANEKREASVETPTMEIREAEEGKPKERAKWERTTGHSLTG